jgi:hypothetical protein
MFDIYQSRRKPQYELVVPHGTNIAAYDRWNGDWRRIRTTENPGREERESITNIGHYLAGEKGIFSKKWTRWTVDRQPNRQIARQSRLPRRA